MFRSLSLDEAAAEARTNGKLLLVYVSGKDCAACRQMEQTTWQADSIRVWIEEHAIAIQLDSAQGLSVRTVPTVIALRNDAELDRVSGMRRPSELLEWLNGLAAGRTELERLRQTPREDLHSRLKLAKTLVERCCDDEALEEFVWLWEHSLEVDEAWYGVRGSFLIAALRPLIARSDAARHRFAAIRDAAESRLPEEDVHHDWFTLNELLGEDERFLQWAARLDDPGLVRDHDYRRLVERFDRWTDLARLVTDPVEVLREQHQSFAHVLASFPDWLDAAQREDVRSDFTRYFRDLAVALHRAMRAAGRIAEAESTAAAARELDPSAEMASALA